jgi:hypothetical protein
MNKVIDCSPGTLYGPYHWVSRAPRPILPITNLLRIYNPDCWILIIISMVTVFVFLKVAARLGSYYGVGFPEQTYIVLFPFR